MLKNFKRIFTIEKKFFCQNKNLENTEITKDFNNFKSSIDSYSNVIDNSLIFRRNNIIKIPQNNFDQSFYNVSNKKFTLGYRAEDLDAKPIQKNKYDNVKLSFGREARNNLLQGIKIMADNVAITYGPLGKNVVIDYEESPIVTKDGVTVAKHIYLRNRQKNIGCRLLSIIAGNTNEYAGDGTTTATVLAGELSK
jgi:hypothetical protein